MSLILTCISALLLTTTAAGNDEIDNHLAEAFRAYTRIHKLMRAMELFSCESSMEEYLSIAKFLMPEGCYCDVNLIDASGNIEMRLSSIKSTSRHERRTTMIVDASCTSTGNLLKSVCVLHFRMWQMTTKEKLPLTLLLPLVMAH
jgi:hypothetical protein